MKEASSCCRLTLICKLSCVAIHVGFVFVLIQISCVQHIQWSECIIPIWGVDLGVSAIGLTETQIA